jgi:hypothetical protein
MIASARLDVRFYFDDSRYMELMNAVTLSDIFAGIRPPNVPGFMIAQVSGALLALWISRWLFQLAAVHRIDS